MLSKLHLGTPSKFFSTFKHSLASIIPKHLDRYRSCTATDTLLSKRHSKYTCRITCSTQANQWRSNMGSLPMIIDTTSDVSKKEIVTLYNVLDDVVNEIDNFLPAKEMSFANNRLKKMLKHILPRGLTCGALFLVADRFYAKQRRASNTLLKNEDEHFRLAAVLCWAFEMCLKNWNMQDDIIDGSIQRNGIPSWHTQDGTGLQAIRDTHVVAECAKLLLIKHFKTQEYYTELLELFIEGTYQCHVGLSQMEMIRPSHDPLTQKSVEEFKAGRRYGFGAFFPAGAVVSAMIINKAIVPQLMSTVNEIGLDIGLLSTCCEDYIDCYADVSVNERETNDIQEGKQSLLYWKALELANPTQTEILKKSYGKYDSHCITTVKNIYEDLRIQENIYLFLEEMSDDIENRISKLPQENVPWNSYLHLIKHYRGVIQGHYARP